MGERIFLPPIVELDDVKKLSTFLQDSKQVPSYESRVLPISKTKAVKWIEEISRIIPRDHLNEEELAHVDDIISPHFDFYHLPGDKLGKPNAQDFHGRRHSGIHEAILVSAGFYQIRIEETDARKTAFSMAYGYYEYKWMPFGLRNATATFQRLMDFILTGLQETELFVYDIIIYASSLAEHRAKFDKLSQRLRNANLKLQSSNCKFLHREVAYLGHIINEETVLKSCPGKIAAVREFLLPKTAKKKCFINKFSHILKPLTSLLRKDVTFY